MKRVIALALALLLIGSVALADTMAVAADTDKIRVTVSEGTIKKNYIGDEDTYLELKIVIENKTSSEITMTCTSATFDDWEVESSCYIDVKPRKKKKDTISVHYEQADLTDFKDVDVMTLAFHIISDDDIFDSEDIDSKPISGKWLSQHIKADK